MRALTLWQPWASLVALDVKTIETRSWSTSYRGPLAIHAGSSLAGLKAIECDYEDGWRIGTLDGDDSRSYHWQRIDGHHVIRGYSDEGPVDFPLSAVVATCNLVDVIPCHDTCAQPIPDDLFYVTIDGRGLYRQQVTGDPWVASNVHQIDMTKQLPYGDFTPGRYAWLLDDIKPTTERCPVCMGLPSHWCRACNNHRVCDPIPAKGRQGLWEWTP